MKALVFAAGLGTRLRPLTDSMPKALVPVGGVPMLERVIRKLVAAGFDDIVVNAHHFADMIVRFIDENEGFGARVAVSLEKEKPLETGGGIKKAAQMLGPGRFLVHNVDMLTDLDLKWFALNDVPGSLATLLLVDAEADRYLLFDDEMRLRGWTNVKTGEVKSPFPDFNPALYRKYSFCGIHIVSDDVFTLMEDWPESFSITDFYIRSCAAQDIRGVVAEDLKIIDIGSPEKLAEAEMCYSMM